MMRNIYFYNYYHNGDLFCSKSFIKQIVDELRSESFNFKYFHNNNPKTISDLTDYGGRPYQSNKDRFIKDNDTLSINTWIGIHIPGNHATGPFFWNEGINYVALHDIWNYNFENINSHFGTKLRIKKSPEDYISVIDYSKFDVTSVNDFIQSRPEKKRILFSNGIPMSGQSFSDKMDNIINYFAAKYSDYDFYCTDRIATYSPNVFFTSDITKQKSDLNEISWLSKHCDLIIGKNSGPFIYCLERDNFNDPKKKFISFNNNKVDSLDWGIKVLSDYTCCTNFDVNEIVKLIDRKIGEL